VLCCVVLCCVVLCCVVLCCVVLRCVVLYNNNSVGSSKQLNAKFTAGYN